MTSLVKAIQERLAKICHAVARDPLMPAGDEVIYNLAVYVCAAAIRAADLSDLEPKGVGAEITCPACKGSGEGPIHQYGFDEAEPTQCQPCGGTGAVDAFAALAARLEAAERGANRYKIIHNGDLPGYAIMSCDDENRDVSLDGDALDEAIDDALKERK